MNLEMLSEIGEWVAYGFYEAKSKCLPWPREYGLSLRRLYENMDVRVPDDKFLIPVEPYFNAINMESHNLWFAPGLIIDFNHHSGYKINPIIADMKKAKYPAYGKFIDELVRDFQDNIVHFGGYTHSNPDIARVVNEGFINMVKELDNEIAMLRPSDTNENELNLLLSLKDYTEGIKAYHKKIYAALKRKVELSDNAVYRDRLKIIRDAFCRSFLYPAESFLEGILAVNLTWMLDFCDSIGRLDQALGKLFEKDISSHKLDIGFARQLLDEMWYNFEKFNGWNLQIRGYTPEGKDGCNALTKECILACGRNKLRRPNVAFRITKYTPEDLIKEALTVLKKGSGRPALYNDDLYVKTLYSMDLGLSKEDARRISFGGCTETMIEGMSNVGSLEGTINLAKALELALYDGYDPVAQSQSGPHTGKFEKFKSFNTFLRALKRQIQFLTDSFASEHNYLLKERFTKGDPKIPRTRTRPGPQI